MTGSCDNCSRESASLVHISWRGIEGNFCTRCHLLCGDAETAPVGEIDDAEGRVMPRTPNFGTYYVAFGKFTRAHEAVVNPETTRAGIIDAIKHSDFGFNDIVAVHEITIGEPARDVTEEILRAAGKWFEEETQLSPADLQDARFDHARDMRKHEAA